MAVKEIKGFALYMRNVDSLCGRSREHHVLLGEPFLPSDKDLPRLVLPTTIDSLGKLFNNLKREHSFGFEQLDEAVKCAERILCLNEEPCIEIFDPENDTYAIDIKEMHIIEDRVYLGSPVITIDYAWGTRSLNHQVSEQNLFRYSRVKARWDETQRKHNAINN